MENVCLECKNKFMGRSDKKFCSDQCRWLYNNRTKTDKEAYIIQINSILRKNRTLLKQTNPIGKTTIRKEVLTQQGFDFRFFTHIFTTKSNQVYYFCYEYGYSFVADEKVVIVNWQGYMSPSEAL